MEKKTSSDNVLWKITSIGVSKLKYITNRSKANYEAEQDNKIKIVVFDVPEKEKWKRGWLRDALRSLDFKMLQKSVWAGKSKIPEAFLEDLRKKHLLGCVHILEVSKAGTVRELI